MSSSIPQNSLRIMNNEISTDNHALLSNSLHHNNNSLKMIQQIDPLLFSSDAKKLHHDSCNIDEIFNLLCEIHDSLTVDIVENMKLYQLAKTARLDRK